MSYQKAIYDREHPRYSEPTEYITMDVTVCFFVARIGFGRKERYEK